MITIILGTKAQLIKMGPVMRALADRKIPYRYVSTGQHRETMDELHENFGIRKPDLFLYQGADIVSIPQMFAWAIRILWKTLWSRKEIFSDSADKKNGLGIVLVHGDTFSTLLGALMGKLAGYQVGHVESGLRSFNLFHPFPEELTRILTFYFTDVYFCPNEWAAKNLDRHSGKKVITGGNTLLDSVRVAVQVPTSSAPLNHDFLEGEFAVVTLHRFENFKDEASTSRIVVAIEMLAEKVPLVFILHLVTERNLKKHGLFERLKANPRIHFRPRYDYFRFLQLMRKARFVVSDGGSNQEECSYLGIPVLLLRDATERQEGLGQNVVLSRFDQSTISHFALNPEKFRRDEQLDSGSPSQVIVDECLKVIASPA